MVQAMKRILHAKTEILAISELDADPWHTIDSPYVEANCVAARRGVKVSRLMLQRGDHAISSELRWVLERYKRAGVSCRFMRYADASRQIAVVEELVLQNLLIVDRQKLMRSEAPHHDGTLEGFGPQMEHAIRAFHSLWQRACDVEPRVERVAAATPDADVIVIGAGAVGTNTAIFLDRLGFDVILTDTAPRILQGGTRASFLNHGDGLEYFRHDNSVTGKECIDGSLVKGLIYPMDCFKTDVCDAYGVRFLVAKKSETQVDLDRFHENAVEMQKHFTKQFDRIKKAYSFTDDEMQPRFLRRPEDFQRVLQPDDYDDMVPGTVVGGCAGSSFGIRMGAYYAMLRTALDESRVRFIGAAPVEHIEKAGQWYRIRTSRGTFTTRDIVISAGHRSFSIASMVPDGGLPLFSGSYHLRAMTIVRLPKERTDKYEQASRITFTLQGEHGGMYACFRPPTPEKDGLAALYWPSTKGSHVKSHAFESRFPSAPPEDWDAVMRDDHPPDDPRGVEILKHAATLYRVLEDDYAQISHTIYRTVFSVGRTDDQFGADLNVRFMQHRDWNVTNDERVTLWLSPKWTNAELVALTAARHVYRSLQGRTIPAEKPLYFGPDRIDVPAQLHFQHLRNARLARYALEYEKLEGYA